MFSAQTLLFLTFYIFESLLFVLDLLVSFIVKNLSWVAQCQVAQE